MSSDTFVSLLGETQEFEMIFALALGIGAVLFAIVLFGSMVAIAHKIPRRDINAKPDDC